MLAAVVVARSPGSVAWALGLLVGINLFLSDLGLVMTAIARRSRDYASRPTAFRRQPGLIPSSK
jgi:hypothetical protein